MLDLSEFAIFFFVCFSIRGSGGVVAVNGQPRDNSKPHAFRRLSCYIQQDDALRPLLRVQEALLLAANLKLGSSVSLAHKKRTVSVRSLLAKACKFHVSAVQSGFRKVSLDDRFNFLFKTTSKIIPFQNKN